MTRTSKVCNTLWDKILHYIFDYFCKLTKYYISGIHTFKTSSKNVYPSHVRKIKDKECKDVIKKDDGNNADTRNSQ